MLGSFTSNFHEKRRYCSVTIDAYFCNDPWCICMNADVNFCAITLEMILGINFEKKDFKCNVNFFFLFFFFFFFAKYTRQK